MWGRDVRGRKQIDTLPGPFARVFLELVCAAVRLGPASVGPVFLPAYRQGHSGVGA